MILSSKQPLRQKFAFLKHNFIKPYDRYLFCKHHQYCLKFLIVFFIIQGNFSKYAVISLFLMSIMFFSVILKVKVWSYHTTYAFLVRKWTLNHLATPDSLAKWLSVCLLTKWLLVQVPAQSLEVNGSFLNVVLMV